MKKKAKKTGAFKAPTKAQLAKLLAEIKEASEAQRFTPNSSLIVGPHRPCCWYHTPLC